ncbi:Glycosyltransferase sdnJ [Colletotrichum sidae]|uniref:Glycosyltransferase sdnJ n=1 Tax=Colletotrichum sidae TaxID=1347389 RepID=A0A4R8TR53_9PEZI|nr:Glycosyltransferase sdnJ [Colletotrichum sidae]
MSKRSILLLTVVIGLLGGLIPLYQRTNEVERPPPISGKNNTVLFLVNVEHGLSNVHIATTFALLERHPEITVHFCSWDRIEKKVERVSTYARSRTPQARPAIFHTLPDSIPTMSEASLRPPLELMAPPGIAGLETLTSDMQNLMAPWTAEDHLALVGGLKTLIADVDPAVVVLDMFLRPALDATRNMNRLHAILTPNVLADCFSGFQPWLKGFWKYPALGSGHFFPVPWRDIPSNIYQSAKFAYSVLFVPALAEKRKFLAEHGVKDPINFFNIYQPGSAFISQDTPGASVPIEYTPPNVTATGPIAISVATAEEQDPELAAWLARAPTVLINLGSFLEFDGARAGQMAAALKVVLEKTGIQVLWKMLDPVFHERKDEDWKPFLQDFIDSDRVRVSSWLTVDPAALLETGHMVASVHHGGANCYHEAVMTGVPHIILPAWLDLYNYAARVEAIDIGVWGNRQTAPGFSVDELASAFLKLVDGGPDSISMRKNTEALAKSIKRPGRDVAADEIAKLAATGH